MNGTITKDKLKNGRVSWGYVFDAGRDQTEKRRQLTKQGFESKREADEALRRALAATGLAKKKWSEEFKPRPVKSVFAELLDKFLSNTAIDCSLGTLEAYRKQSRYARRDLGELPVDQRSQASCCRGRNLSTTEQPLRLIAPQSRWSVQESGKGGGDPLAGSHPSAASSLAF